MRVALAGVLCVLVLFSWPGESLEATLFRATPLVDFTPTQQYLGEFQGLLYTDPATRKDTNSVPAQHDADGRTIANQIVPLDASGNPSAAGKIGVVGIGMSNWTAELCVRGSAQPPDGGCTSNSFIGLAGSSSQVNHKTLVLADCARGGQVAYTWVDDLAGNYTTCLNMLSGIWGITAAQVEVVLWKNANPDPTIPLQSTTVCHFVNGVTSLNPAAGDTDACAYEQYVGMMARFLRTVFPNIRQLFVHPRIYGGYARVRLNPEPYAYEYGFATKWLVNAQVVQVARGTVDPVAGDLDYRNGAAPWIAWGPYWWAAGPTPCVNCQVPGQTWLPTDFDPADGTHPSSSGVTKVAANLMNYYLTSPYTPWFRAVAAFAAARVPSVRLPETIHLP